MFGNIHLVKTHPKLTKLVITHQQLNPEKSVDSESSEFYKFFEVGFDKFKFGQILLNKLAADFC
jgi:hypothetical protein